MALSGFGPPRPAGKMDRSLRFQSTLCVLIWYYQFKRDVKLFLVASKTARQVVRSDISLFYLIFPTP
jgi:hypothetical protein